jgi:hypothetical protein
VEADSNISTTALGLIGDEKGTQCLGLSHPVPEKQGLTLQVGGASNLETVKYDQESHGTWTRK